MRNVSGITSLLKVAVVLVTLTGCARGKDEGQSHVRIQFPAAQSLTYQNVSQSVSTAWGVSDPTTTSEIVCYGVLVGGPEPLMSSKTCKDSAGQSLLTYGTLAGALPAQSGTIQVSVASGKDRVITIIGWAAASSTACVQAETALESARTNLSAPRILGSTKLDLAPGDMTIDIKTSLTGSSEIEDCTAPFFSKSANAPATPTTAVLNVTGGNPYSFGTVATSSTNHGTITITNNGVLAATSLSASGPTTPYSFKDGTYPGTGGTCAATLAAGASCTMVVSFSPSTASTYTNQIVLNYHNGAAAASLLVNITGLATSLANLSISDGSVYMYGSVPIAGIVNKTFTITNSGPGTATSMNGGGLATPFIFLGGSYPGTGGTCGSNLSASATCTVVVKFAPVSATTFNDTLEITYNDGVSPQTAMRSISGTGVLPATLSLSDGPTFDYGSITIGNYSDHTFTLTNSGGVAGTALSGSALGTAFTYKGGSFPGTGGTCSSTLAAGGSCTVVVTFTPVSAVLYSNSILINYHDGNANQGTSRAIQGTGTP